MRYEPAFVNAGKITKGHISRCASRNLYPGEKERFFRGESCGLVIFFPYRNESQRNKNDPRIQIYRVIPALLFDRRRISRANFSGANRIGRLSGKGLLNVSGRDRDGRGFFYRNYKLYRLSAALASVCGSFRRYLDNEDHLRLKRCVRQIRETLLLYFIYILYSCLALYKLIFRN